MKIRIVVFRKYADADGRDTCDFASEVINSDELHAAADIDAKLLSKLGKLGDRMHGYLGGEATGADVFGHADIGRVVALSREHRMVEIWERPSAFKAERLNGRVINGFVYRWRSSIVDALGEGN